MRNLLTLMRLRSIRIERKSLVGGNLQGMLKGTRQYMNVRCHFSEIASEVRFTIPVYSLKQIKMYYFITEIVTNKQGY